MKLKVFNMEDGEPKLDIQADELQEEQQLQQFYNTLQSIHLVALRSGWAGPGNPCGSLGSLGDNEGMESLTFSLRLGGPSLGEDKLKVIEAVLRRNAAETAEKIAEVL